MSLPIHSATLGAALVTALAFGCSKSSESPADPSLEPASRPAPPPPADPEGLTPPAEPPGAQPPTVAPTASDVAPRPGRAQGTQPPANENCMKECLARNQMRAESAEKIEAQCRAECQ